LRRGVFDQARAGVRQAATALIIWLVVAVLLVVVKPLVARAMANR
jgi:hypothetical protein